MADSDLEGLDSLDEPTVMKAAVAQVKILTEAADRYHRYVVLLSLVLVVLVVVVGGLGYLLSQQAATARQQAAFSASLRQDAISACESGNSYRAAQVRIWDEFIAVITQGSHDRVALAKARAFTVYVSQTDALNDCQRLYGAR